MAPRGHPEEQDVARLGRPVLPAEVPQSRIHQPLLRSDFAPSRPNRRAAPRARARPTSRQTPRTRPRQSAPAPSRSPGAGRACRASPAPRSRPAPLAAALISAFRRRCCPTQRGRPSASSSPRIVWGGNPPEVDEISETFPGRFRPACRSPPRHAPRSPGTTGARIVSQSSITRSHDDPVVLHHATSPPAAPSQDFEPTALEPTLGERAPGYAERPCVLHGEHRPPRRHSPKVRVSNPQAEDPSTVPHRVW